MSLHGLWGSELRSCACLEITVSADLTLVPMLTLLGVSVHVHLNMNMSVLNYFSNLYLLGGVDATEHVWRSQVNLQVTVLSFFHMGPRK